MRGVGEIRIAAICTGGPDGEARSGFRFDACIIAAGSESVSCRVPARDARIIDSTGALELADIPQRLLVVGGGIIGLEMACVYDALGAKVTVVELTDGLIPGADRDLVKSAREAHREALRGDPSQDQGGELEARPEGLHASFEGEVSRNRDFNRVLVAVGRRPNGADIGAERAGVAVDERGFITVDQQMRTNVPHIFAIGDICGEPMLAHKATHEAKVAAEAWPGTSSFDAMIPSVAYTDPEIAWVGLSESEAKTQGWASARRVSMGRERPGARDRPRRGLHQAAIR